MPVTQQVGAAHRYYYNASVYFIYNAGLVNDGGKFPTVDSPARGFAKSGG